MSATARRASMRSGSSAEQALVRGHAVLEPPEPPLALRPIASSTSRSSGTSRASVVSASSSPSSSPSARRHAARRRSGSASSGRSFVEPEERVARVGEALLGLLREAELRERRRVLGLEPNGARERLDRLRRLPEPHPREPEPELRREALRLHAHDALERRARRLVLLGLLAELAEQVEDVGAIRRELARAPRRRRGLGVPPERTERRRVLDAELRVVALVEARLLELGRGLGVLAAAEPRAAPPRGASRRGAPRGPPWLASSASARVSRAMASGARPILRCASPSRRSSVGSSGLRLTASRSATDLLLRVLGALVTRRDQAPTAPGPRAPRRSPSRAARAPRRAGRAAPASRRGAATPRRASDRGRARPPARAPPPRRAPRTSASRRARNAPRRRSAARAGAA